MINLEKLSKEHEALFPNATLESQVWKLEEEIKEYRDATSVEQLIKEAADVIIVCAGLFRWCPTLAKIIAADFCVRMTEEEVNRKWQVNLNRKWEWNGKTYKHVGHDQYE